MKKQVTFESSFDNAEDKALEWIVNLSKCFNIRSAKLKCYKNIRSYYTTYKCRVEVKYD